MEPTSIKTSASHASAQFTHHKRFPECKGVDFIVGGKPRIIELYDGLSGLMAFGAALEALAHVSMAQMIGQLPQNIIFVQPYHLFLYPTSL